MNLVDTHAHLDFLPDIEGWLERARAAGVDKIVTIGTSVDSSKKCVEIAQKYSTDDLSIWSTVGIHAEDGKGDIEKYGSWDKCIEELRKIAKISSKVVGVGECGYDFKGDKQSLRSSSGIGQIAGLRDQLSETRNFQKELFDAQIKLACELNLPLIIHCRNGFDETFELLDSNSEKLNAKGVFHSWTGDWKDCQKALDLGFYISFSGILTFKNAPLVVETAKKVPLSRVILETDSPFLAPEPVRGSKNEPKNVKIIGEFLAELRNIPLDEIADVTSRNAKTLFGFKI